jgi:Family of unknown function (DUF5317)
VIVIALVLVALLSVPLLGGRWSALVHVPLRGTWLVLAGFGIQLVVISVVPDLPHGVAAAVHLASYALAGIFFLMNRHLRFMWIVGAGGLLNLLPIVANAGVMPASAWAERTAGLTDSHTKFSNSTVLAHPRLRFLGDVFPIPRGWPLANVFSVGDVVLVVGLVLVLHAATGARWLNRATPADDAAASPTDGLQRAA